MPGNESEVELALDRAAKQRGFRVFPVLLPGLEPFDPNSLPPFLRTRTWVDFRLGVESERALEDLIRAVKGIPFGPDVAIEPREDVCPYRGLQVFDERHAEYFFGRDADVQRLLERLKVGRFLAVVGASGSGKSSLVRAGLVPSLHSGRLPGSEQWRILVFRPGGRPLAALAAQLLRLSGERGMQHTVDELASDRRTLHLAASLALAGQPPERRVAFVVDQFEEVFTLCRDEDERSALIDNLLYAATVPDGQATVLLTLRADFYPRLARYRELAQLAQAQQLLVPPLDEDGLRQAVEQPAFRAGLEIEAGLVDTVLADVTGQPGVLPLLEHALLETWRRRRGGMLTLEGYRESGGVRGALSDRAEEIYASLGADQQTLARRLLLRLTEPGEGTEDTRRRAAVEELVSSPGERGALEEVIRDLTNARLLTTTGEGKMEERWVDVSHEALIRGWPRLRGWIEEDRAGLRTHRQLTDAAQDWERLDRDPGAVLRGARLAETIEWQQRDSPDLNQLERDFLRASQAAKEDELTRGRRRVRRLRALALGLVTLLLVAAGAAFLAARQTEKADRQARFALSRALAAEALTNLDSDLALAMLLSLEAYHREPTVEARNALITSIQASERVEAFLPGHTGAVKNVAFSPDGETLASAGDDGVRLWDVGRKRQFGKPLPAPEAFAVAFSPDGDTLASGGKDVRLWDVGRRHRLGKPLPGRAFEVAFSPDGETLASANGDDLRLWDVERRRQLGKPLPHRAIAVAFSPDAQTLASAGINDLRLWDVGRRRPLSKRLPAPEAFAVAFSPDGETLASGGTDVRLWDVGRRRQLGKPLPAPRAENVAFSPDGETLASANGDDGVRLWDVERRRQLGEPLPAPKAFAVAFSPDGETLASGGDDLRLWDIGRRRTVGKPLAADTLAVAFSPNGETLASDSIHNVELWDVERRRQLGKPLPGSAYALAFSPDGETLASSGNGETLASVGDDDTRLWDVGLRRQLGKPLPAAGNAVAFSPDGETLALAGYDDIRLWDVGRRRQLGKPIPAPEAFAVAFSPDGDTLASGSDDLRLWDVEGRRQLGKPLPAAADAVAFSPDGGTLASAGDDLRLWDVEGRRQLGKPLPAPETIAVAFSPDGDTLASAGYDDIRLWDVGRRRRLGKPLPAAANAVAFTADGETLASAGDQLIVWPSVLTTTREDMLSDYLCPIVRRNLTRDEWDFYLPDEPYRATCKRHLT